MEENTLILRLQVFIELEDDVIQISVAPEEQVPDEERTYRPLTHDRHSIHRAPLKSGFC